MPKVPPLTLLVGTGNAHKLEEIARVLATDALQVVGAGSIPARIDALEPPIEETGATFAENARLKALGFAARALRLEAEERPDWVIADDSGLCVDALDGAPGVRSARYAGENATDEANNALLLALLDGVPPERRDAEFVCVIAAVRLRERAGPPAVDFCVEGRCRGTIRAAASGAGGFGYDPLFFVPELGKTFAELPRDAKNSHSHRGRALRALRERLVAES